MSDSPVQIAKKISEIKKETEILEHELKTLYDEWRSLEEELIEIFLNDGVNSVKLDGIGNFILSQQDYFSVTKDNESKFYDYLKRTGNGDIIREYVNPKTLSAFLKNHIEIKTETMINRDAVDPFIAKESVLDELKNNGANVFTKRSIQIRKG